MPRRPKPLTRPYRAYDYREVPDEDTELTHVGPGTPGGEYLRRFWQPVALASELTDLPRRLRILGEDLVLFRDGAGRTGLLQLYCSHRGTSLEFGLISERGLRCCYHGWLFDVDGTILETPGERATSTLRQRLCHGAYPTYEYRGLIFAYLGPPDRRPAFAVYDTFEKPGVTMKPAAWIWPANWIQIRENSMDPIHTSFLHTIVTGAQFTEEFGVIPETEWQETPIGMIYVATRRVKENLWTRIADFILPNVHQFPSNWTDTKNEALFRQPMMTNWSVPIDDTHTLIIGFFYQDDRSGVDFRQMLEDLPGQVRERTYAERQRQPGDYEAQVLQRPIAIHALEHLGATDRGVIMFRKLVRSGIRAVATGRDPKGWRQGPGAPIVTYCQDAIQRVPMTSSERDGAVMRDVGREIASGRYRMCEHGGNGCRSDS